MSDPRTLRALLVRAARRHSRVAHEVEDLAHDLIVSALRRGTSLDDTFLRTAHGAARRHAAMLARTAVRRRRRELQLLPPAASELVRDEPTPPALSALSPALRTTLLLLVQGLEKAELRLALGVTDAALRKRFQALRDHAPLPRPALPPPARTSIHVRLRRTQVDLLPRLAPARPRVLATADPDGHGLIFAASLTSVRSAATGR